jgi:hypothetical protein
MDRCKICNRPAVTASAYCLECWNEAWNLYQKQVTDRFLISPSDVEVRIPVPGDIDIDSCWVASGLDDDTPAQLGYYYSHDTETRQIWHKLEKTSAA